MSASLSALTITALHSDPEQFLRTLVAKHTAARLLLLSKVSLPSHRVALSHCTVTMHCHNALSHCTDEMNGEGDPPRHINECCPPCTAKAIARRAGHYCKLNQTFRGLLPGYFSIHCLLTRFYSPIPNPRSSLSWNTGSSTKFSITKLSNMYSSFSPLPSSLHA